MDSPSNCRTKVFGVGLSRTGTFSLHVALQILGYRSVHCPKTLLELEGHDAAVDTTVACAYPALDVFYGGALFILTVREPEQWAKSMLQCFGGNGAIDPDSLHSRLKYALFGRTPFEPEHEGELVDKMKAHERNVIEYFSYRPGALLVMNICDGDGWEPLCRHLGMPIPSVPFPKVKCL